MLLWLNSSLKTIPWLGLGRVVGAGEAGRVERAARRDKRPGWSGLVAGGVGLRARVNRAD
jgi:hypothetical protein